MSDTYKLLFRGEVLEGQHPAVVRRRLGEVLGLDEPRLERLFGGQPVVVRAEADADTATRLQALFRKAGARLRVVAVPPAEPAESAQPSGPAFDPELLPVGSDVLRDDEREPWCPREIDTDHLALQDPAQLVIDAGPPPPPPPDTSRFRLLEP
jgi:hypothetical protein